MKRLAALSILFAVVVLTGCDDSRQLDLVYLPDQVQPVPVVDLPVSMRVENWTGRSQDGDVGGSCVHASTINTFRSSGRSDLENAWFQNRNRGYAGPETGRGIMDKLSANRVSFAWTASADPELFQWSTDTRRQGVIFYYPSHCVNFQEFATLEDGREVAVLLDNNFPDYYIVVDRELFLRSWRYYGGFGFVPSLTPTTPRTFPRAYERNSDA
jgi:hypothetical protein